METIDATPWVAIVILAGAYLHARWTAQGLRAVCSEHLKKLGQQTDMIVRRDKTIVELRERLANSEGELDSAIDTARVLLAENQRWRLADAQRRLRTAD
jgi:hypothetical protein